MKGNARNNIIKKETEGWAVLWGEWKIGGGWGEGEARAGLTDSFTPPKASEYPCRRHPHVQEST